jgi:hypothetical protein
MPQPILGDESQSRTAKRFDTKENPTASQRPALAITYTGPTGINDVTQNLPDRIELFQNYPNPFNPTTLISFNTPSAGLVKLTVYDLLGQVVETLVNAEMPVGYHEITFDAVDLVSGPYYYQLEAGDKIQVRKMVLLK